MAIFKPVLQEVDGTVICPLLFTKQWAGYVIFGMSSCFQTNLEHASFRHKLQKDNKKLENDNFYPNTATLFWT